MLNKKNLLWIAPLLLTLICIGTIFAMEFDNSQKVLETIGKAGYNDIEINNWLGLGNTLWSGTLDYNSNNGCSSDCEAIQTITLHEKGSLVDDVIFKTKQEDGKWIEQEIRNYQVYVNDKEYILGTEMNVGTYKVKLEGSKKSSRIVDWIYKTQGETLLSWAEWGASDLTNNLTLSYRLDNSSGDIAFNDVEGVHGDFDSTPTWITGKINNAVRVSTNAIDTNIKIGNNKFSISCWVNSSSSGVESLWGDSDSAQTGGIYSMIRGDTGGKLLLYVRDSGGFTLSGSVYSESVNLQDSQWHHVVQTFDGTDQWKLYIDNSSMTLSDTTGILEASPYNLTFGGALSNTKLIGDLDNCLVYNETLSVSKINQLWNSGNGVQYPFPVGLITLNSPEDDYNSSLNEIQFNATAIVTGTTLTNMSLWHNASGSWERNQTITISGTTNSSTINQTFQEGENILWGMEVCDSDGDCGFSTENRTFSIDTTAPSIIINEPTSTINFGSLSTNETLNWTVSDTNLDSCWIEYNLTNTTVTCGDNNYSFILEDDVYNITFWANDSVGNINSSFMEWEYNIFVNNETYDPEIPEGALNEFGLFITARDGISLTQAIFNYNNTNYTTSVSYDSGNYTITASTFSPTVINDTNYSFNFFLVVDGDTYELTTHNQSVLNLNFGECGGISNDTLLNIFLKKEIEKTNLTGDIEIGGEIISKSSGLEVATIYQKFNSTSNASICFSPPTDYDLYYFNSEIKYSAEGYAPELYIIQQANMGDYPKNLSLFDLDLNHSTEFLIKYQDDSLIPVEGAVVQILRKYISEGIYETVEAPLTSNIGTTTAHIDLNTNLYKAIVVKNGEVLDIFDNLVFDCESELSGICTQNLFGAIDPQNSISVDVLEDFTAVVTESNNTITTTFSIPSGTSSLINVLLEQQDTFGNTYLCNQTITSSSGSIDCDYNDTIGDSVVYLTISKDGEVEVEKGYVIPEAGGIDFLGNNFFIVLILLLSLVGMAMASPEWIIIIGVVTFVLAGGIWLLNGLNFVVGLGSLIWILIAAIILILKLSKQEDK